MRIVSIDIEGTGLDIEKHDILEFGAVLDDTDYPEVPLLELPKFHCYFLKNEYVGEAYAIGMHNQIWQKIGEFQRNGKNPNNDLFIRPDKFGNIFKGFLIKHGYQEIGNRVPIIAAGKNFASSRSLHNNQEKNSYRTELEGLYLGTRLTVGAGSEDRQWEYWCDIRAAITQCGKKYITTKDMISPEADVILAIMRGAVAQRLRSLS